MTNRAFMTLLDDLHKKELSILSNRADKYSNETDRLVSFRNISQFIGAKPPLVAFSLMMKHMMALRDWIDRYNKDRLDDVDIEDFKTIEEYIIDIRNYLAFVYALLYENIIMED